MKLKSDKTRDEILRIAREEFTSKGFRDASLREMANKAGKTTGIIYTYFRNKNELFEQLVHPVIIKINSKLSSKAISLVEAKEEGINLRNWFTQYIRFLIELTESNRSEMELLFLKSDGSSYENYRNELIEDGIQRSKKEFRKLTRTKVFKDQVISDFFIGNLVNYVFHICVEILKQNSSKKQIDYYEKEITAFLFSGWKALVEI